MKHVPYVLAMLVALVFGVARAEGAAGKERGELAKAMATAKVSLEAGLAAITAEGKPISAKFEMEDGKLQLSVYTEKDAKFSEVIVDHQTGKVVKTEGITEGEDLSAAKTQSAAMAKAKSSLKDAVGKATAAHGGSLAVSVVPKLRHGRSTADVTLVKGKEWKTVTEKLD